MNSSLLFLPDISGYTEFVQNTEAEHSRHVISELLEVLIEANTEELQLAEIEGDALFFYKENEIPSLEKLLAQVEHMFTAFYSHLKLLEKNRICPCNACLSAPKLQLKIVAHAGELKFINVQNNRKPFGSQVIEAHRLLKNSVASDNYVLLSDDLTEQIGLTDIYKTKLFNFAHGNNTYDGKQLNYLFSIIDKNQLKLKPLQQAKKVTFNKPPTLSFKKEFSIAAQELLEYITNYSYRKHWVSYVNRFEFKPNSVTRIGSEHVCVINEKHFNFTSVVKDVNPGELIYGEKTTSPPSVDAMYQFFTITPLAANRCQLTIDIHFEAKSLIKRIMLFYGLKRMMQKNIAQSIEKLYDFIDSNKNTTH